MSAQIKEAREALALVETDRGLSLWPSGTAALKTIRSALEAAQQEAEAWEWIEKWRSKGPQHRTVTIMPLLSGTGKGTDWYIEFREQGLAVTEVTTHGQSTRLEALTKGAAWCRADLAK